MYFPQIRQLDNYNVLIEKEKKENRHDKQKSKTSDKTKTPQIQ